MFAGETWPQSLLVFMRRWRLVVFAAFASDKIIFAHSRRDFV